MCVCACVFAQVSGGRVGSEEGYSEEFWEGLDEGLEPTRATTGQFQRLWHLRAAICRELLRGTTRNESRRGNATRDNNRVTDHSESSELLT